MEPRGLLHVAPPFCSTFEGGADWGYAHIPTSIKILLRRLASSRSTSLNNAFESQILSAPLIVALSNLSFTSRFSAWAIGLPTQSFAWLSFRQGPPVLTAFCAARRSAMVRFRIGLGHSHAVTTPIKSSGQSPIALPSGTDTNLRHSDSSGGGVRFILPLSMRK